MGSNRNGAPVYMQTTLLFARIFPPPAARAEVLAGLDGTGAGSAADADEASVVERVVRDVVLPNEVAHLIECPVEERVKFEELVGLVPFEWGHVLAVGRLFSADASDPELLTLQGASEGFHLADVATLLAVFDRIVESVGAFFGQKLFECSGLWSVGVDGLSVAFEGARPSGVGFGEIAPSIEREDADG